MKNFNPFHILLVCAGLILLALAACKTEPNNVALEVSYTKAQCMELDVNEPGHTSLVSVEQPSVGEGSCTVSLARPLVCEGLPLDQLAQQMCGSRGYPNCIQTGNDQVNKESFGLNFECHVDKSE